MLQEGCSAVFQGNFTTRPAKTNIFVKHALLGDTRMNKVRAHPATNVDIIQLLQDVDIPRVLPAAKMNTATIESSAKFVPLASTLRLTTWPIKQRASPAILDCIKTFRAAPHADNAQVVNTKTNTNNRFVSPVCLAQRNIKPVKQIVKHAILVHLYQQVHLRMSIAQHAQKVSIKKTPHNRFAFVAILVPLPPTVVRSNATTVSWTNTNPI